jgi:hypothetical protein
MMIAQALRTSAECESQDEPRQGLLPFTATARGTGTQPHGHPLDRVWVVWAASCSHTEGLAVVRSTIPLGDR